MKRRALASNRLVEQRLEKRCNLCSCSFPRRPWRNRTPRRASGPDGWIPAGRSPGSANCPCLGGRPIRAGLLPWRSPGACVTSSFAYATIGAQDDVGVRPAFADPPHQPRKVLLHPGGPIFCRRAQPRQQRRASAEHQKRHVAVLPVVAVEELLLLGHAMANDAKRRP